MKVVDKDLLAMKVAELKEEARGARRGLDRQQGVVAPAPACGDCARVPRILAFYRMHCTHQRKPHFYRFKMYFVVPHFYHSNQKPSTFTVPPPYGSGSDTYLE